MEKLNRYVFTLHVFVICILNTCAITTWSKGANIILDTVALPKLPSTNAGVDFMIAIANQGAERIQIYDPAIPNWNIAAALIWSWYPNATNGFSVSTAGWGAPSDIKLRNSVFYGGQVMAIADSKGFCGLVPYPAGNARLWSVNVGNPGKGLNNLHAVEVLPNGNVAVAASNGSFVRIYTASQGASSSTYVEFTLADAHGVLWDPTENVLWALGRSVLTALEITGTAAAPVVTEKTSYRVALPTDGGHDLSAYYGDTNKLWVTTNGSGYIFNKKTKTFTALAGTANGTRIKSIGNQPSGQIVEARPSTCADGWNTNTVKFFGPDVSRTITGACLYKARVWWADYQ